MTYIPPLNYVSILCDIHRQVTEILTQLCSPSTAVIAFRWLLDEQATVLVKFGLQGSCCCPTKAWPFCCCARAFCKVGERCLGSGRVSPIAGHGSFNYLVHLIELFTLPHAFHIDSTWTPGTLRGVYMESMYTQCNFFITESRVDLGGLHVDSTWSTWSPGACDHVTWPDGLCADPQVYKEGHLAHIPQLPPLLWPGAVSEIRLDSEW